MSARRLPLAIGLVAFLAAVGVLSGVVTLSLGDFTLILIAISVLFVGFRALQNRYGARTWLETPDPERPRQVAVPGDDLLETVEQFRTPTGKFVPPETRIREGLSAAVVAALTRFEGLSPEEAKERVEEGTWTDDERAAAFLSSRMSTSDPSLRARLTSLVSSSREFRLGVRRTIRAVAEVGTVGVDGDDGPGTVRPDDERTVTAGTTASVSDHDEWATNHWTGVGIVAALAIGLGVVAESPAIVLPGVVGIGYAALARATVAPTPDLTIERRLSDETPEPGDEVDVTVTVTNEGGFLPDLRFVDGVPESLPVTDGVARFGTALRPGESTTLEYTVEVQRGTHEFDPAMAITRDVSRASERVTYVGGGESIVCEPVLRPTAAPVPLRTAAATFAGRLTTDKGGSGTEFHSVREYREGDPLNRIDWNRHARTGELATLEFHEERAANVLVVVDARAAAYVSPGPDAPHAVDRSVDAAGRIAASLLDRGDTVGLTAFGDPARADGGSDVDQCWLAPGSGHHHRVRFQTLLATHPQLDTTPPPTSSRWVRQLRGLLRRLPAETQIVLLSPLSDRGSLVMARRFDAHGHAVTVISPDATADRTASQQLARVARRIRRFDLQRAGIPVVDWRADETLDEAFARTNAGGSR